MPITLSKLVKVGLQQPTELENQIAQSLVDLESTSDLKMPLRLLHLTGAREVDITGGKKAVILFVPVPQLTKFQKIQSRLVRELEKKFSGKNFVIIAQRKILPKPSRKTKLHSKQKRPRSRTLTTVHENTLNDLVYPAEIVGKRIRVKMDGSRLYKVHLDKNQQTNVEHKIDTFASIYKKLTGKDVNFEFKETM
jgi:small subunit ribosomal protein S7e